ncbi:SAM-dependent methyltransferase [Spirillospora sp. CA-294931]|uniref:SAM-dependent methyltransferase n=1 Tax=Spirillospora sp. CA-294931 TaxID=3240042 RepID=UPI003D8CA28F
MTLPQNDHAAVLDLEAPSVARMYDWLLGGKDNYESDRVAVADLIRCLPQAPRLARANRWMIARAVRHALRSGVRQVVDIGGGLPTYPSVLDSTRGEGVRLVLVDRDPVVSAHYRALMPGDEDVHVLQADLTDAVPRLDALIDPASPVAYVFGTVLHYVPGPDAERITAALRARMAPGSQLVITHATVTGSAPETLHAVREVYSRAHVPLACRSDEEIRAFFGDLTLVPPGLVDVDLWQGTCTAPRDPGLRIVGAVGTR